MSTRKTDLGVIARDIQKNLLQKLDESEASVAESYRDKQAYALLRDFSSRPSKRIRGMLVVLSYGMFQGKNLEEACDVAAAVELTQNYLLAIDDVADRSSERRGKKTLHELYEEELSETIVSTAEKTHMSNMLAVHVGLMASHLAGKIMNELQGDPVLVNKAAAVYHNNILVTALGQINDLCSTYDGPLEEQLLHNLSRKSSYYTFVNPMQIGAILAGASDEDLEAINDFGVAAGVAFQLQDDKIGLFGDSSDSGKSNMDDLREGKYTLFIQQTLAKCSGVESEYINSVIGDQDLSVADAEKVRSIIRSYGVEKYVEEVAAEYADKARKVLVEQSWPKDSKNKLLQIIDSLENRIK